MPKGKDAGGGSSRKSIGKKAAAPAAPKEVDGGSKPLDSRFNTANFDPRFKKTPQRQNKVVIDKRFKGMFNEKRFSGHADAVDKYGRKRQVTGIEDLGKFYEQDDDDEDDDDDEEEGGEKAAGGVQTAEDEDSDDDDSGEEGEAAGDMSSAAYMGMKFDPSAEGGSDSDTSDLGADDLDEDEDSDAVQVWPTHSDVLAGGEGPETVRLGASAARLAVMDLDWSQLRASDIFVLLSSFLPLGSRIMSVTVHQSDFGKERQAQETVAGPQALWKYSKLAEGAGGGKMPVKVKLTAGDEQNVDDADDDEDEDEDEDDEGGGEEEEGKGEDEEEESLSSSDPDDDSEAEMEDMLKKGVNVDTLLRQSQMRDRAKRTAANRAERSKKGAGGGKSQSNLDSGSGQAVTMAGQEVNPDALRKYELEKFKYFFAVVHCDAVETAEHLYESCDGMEIETSANMLDLRYIAADRVISSVDNPVRDSCDTAPQLYKPPQGFYSKALQHSKVELTWDADGPERSVLTNKKFSRDDMERNDIDAYLASDQDSSDDERVPGSKSKRKSGKGKSKEGSDEKRAKQAAKYRDIFGLGQAKDRSSKGSAAAAAAASDSSASEEGGSSDGSDSDSDSDSEDDGSEGGMQMEFMPESVEAALAEEKAANGPANKGVWDSYLDKRKAKKKAKTDARKARTSSIAAGGSGLGGADAVQSNEALVMGGGGGGGDGDDPFNDPFFANPNEKKAAGKTARKGKDGKPEPTIEEAEQSRREKAELELLLMDENAEEERHFDVGRDRKMEERQNKKKKGKRGKKAREAAEAAGGPGEDGVDSFKVDIGDSRFNSLFESSKFAIDPTDPSYKKTDGMSAIEAEKSKRRSKKSKGGVPAEAKPDAAGSKKSGKALSNDIAALVGSLKAKGKRASMKK